MERFSDRIGVTQPKRLLQLNEMDDGLRNALWNWLCWLLDTPDNEYRSHNRTTHHYWDRQAQFGLWDEFFHARLDELPRDVKAHIKKFFLAAQWYEVYNLIEFVLFCREHVLSNYEKQRNAPESLNYYLEREMSGWRCIKEQLVPVTSEAEVTEIEIAATARPGFEGVAAHINKAMELLGKKPQPDLLNSVKESISAVEAAAKLITGLSGAQSGGIEPALVALDKKKALNPAFRHALNRLYAYTCNEDGIRHPLLDAPNTSFAEARFMLVACSAFANLLVENAGEKP